MVDTRRNFLKNTGLAASVALASSLAPRQGRALSPRRVDLPDSIQDKGIRDLVMRALDAAKSGGASFADVRLVKYKFQQFGFVFGADQREEQSIGVRVLVNGYWGFASTAILTPDEMSRTAALAVAVAKASAIANAITGAQTTTLAPVPRIADEHWEMPIQIDPFTVPPAEIRDHLYGMGKEFNAAIWRHKSDSDEKSTPGNLLSNAQFMKLEKAFGSTEGSYGTQVMYQTEGAFLVGNELNPKGDPEMRLDILSPAGMGWEMFLDPTIYEKIDAAMYKWFVDTRMPRKPVDVGRYRAVLDSESVSRMLSGTIGAATELDRAMGYEANSVGTSYLNDPASMLGTFKVGSPELTVTTNRSDVRAAATVGWDDEGVRPRETMLIENGILKNFQTTRESVGWLASMSSGMDHGSTGTAFAATGTYEPLCYTGNLVVRPDTTASRTFDGFVEELEHGIVFENLKVLMDFQQLNGAAFGRAYEVRDGKRVAMLNGAGILFRAPELWKSVVGVGGGRVLDNLDSRWSKENRYKWLFIVSRRRPWSSKI